MKICQDCSTEVQETFNFCPNCGGGLDKPLVCKNCNYENEPNSKFCQDCGDHLFEKYKRKNTEVREKSIKPEIIDTPGPTKIGITIEFPYTTAQSFDFAVNCKIRLN